MKKEKLIRKYENILATLIDNKNNQSKSDSYNYDIDISNVKEFIKDLKNIEL